MRLNLVFPRAALCATFLASVFALACEKDQAPASVTDTAADTATEGPDTANAPDLGTPLDDVASPDDTSSPDIEEPEDMTEPDTGVLPEGHARITHSFGVATLKPFQETQPCVSWTVNNDQPIYVQGVTLMNDGAFHHSNWFVVPEEAFPGPDGFFKCKDRNFQEIGAAIEGTVIFAQSTQSRLETQRLPDGVVVKIPPKHKIVATTHLLNLANEEVASELRMSLEIIHPKLVTDITTPFRLTYFDLKMGPKLQTNFTGECDFASEYEAQAEVPLDMKIYWVLPHYHYLGNYFRLAISGGPRDGEVLHSIEQFNADAQGKAFDPPVDLTGAKGLKFTCGYWNPTDKEVGWGVGDQEMCVMLGLASSKIMLDGTVPVTDENKPVGSDKIEASGTCGVFGIPKNPTQTPPTADELAAEFYIPESTIADSGLEPVEACVDTPPEAEPTGPATLASMRDVIFKPACSFSACHGGPKPAAGLSLDAPDLHAELMAHVVTANTDMPLVKPGDPAGSWLYHVLSKCEPHDKAGNPVSPMPRNAPILMDPGLITRVREWIKNGAEKDAE